MIEINSTDRKRFTHVSDYQLHFNGDDSVVGVVHVVRSGNRFATQPSQELPEDMRKALLRWLGIPEADINLPTLRLNSP